MVLPFALALASFVVADRLPVRPPTAVGMSAERLANIDRVIRRGVDAGGFPGASVVIGRRGAAVVQKGYGHTGWTSSAPSVDADRTIYDLASLTKVVGTTTALMVLYDEGRLDLDAPVQRYLPDFIGEGKDAVTVRHLLTHRSGLPAGRELWRIASTPADARRIVLETPLGCRPGVCYTYSDLGADILGWVAESISGQSLDAFLHERVFQPLGMNDTGFSPHDSVRYRVAPTEVSPPRGYPIKGEVHDENAYALGGVAGHAGLFSTSADLAVFAQMMLNGGSYDDVRIVSDSTVALFTRRAAGTRALGWDTADGQGGSGEFLTETAYGHTGYTGTSMWIDPDHEMFVVLLTNRVHAARARRPAKVIADVRADLADAAVLAVVDTDNILAMPASFRADRADGWNPALRARSSRASRAARARAAKARAAKARRAKAAKTAKARSSRAASSKSATAKRSVAKKSVAKKSAAKKSVVKKPVVRKAAPKKSVTKKAAARKPAARKRSSGTSSA